MRTKMRKGLLRRLASGRDGSVILETAIMISMLLMLMFGIVDLGRVLFAENTPRAERASR